MDWQKEARPFLIDGFKPRLLGLASTCPNNLPMEITRIEGGTFCVLAHLQDISTVRGLCSVIFSKLVLLLEVLLSVNRYTSTYGSNKAVLTECLWIVCCCTHISAYFSHTLPHTARLDPTSSTSIYQQT